jgi:hypothetical protein
MEETLKDIELQQLKLDKENEVLRLIRDKEKTYNDLKSDN